MLETLQAYLQEATEEFLVEEVPSREETIDALQFLTGRPEEEIEEAVDRQRALVLLEKERHQANFAAASQENVVDVVKPMGGELQAADGAERTQKIEHLRRIDATSLISATVNDYAADDHPRGQVLTSPDELLEHLNRNDFSQALVK